MHAQSGWGSFQSQKLLGFLSNFLKTLHAAYVFPSSCGEQVASTKCQTFRIPNLGILSDFCSLRLKCRGGLQGTVRCWAQDCSCMHTTDDCRWKTMGKLEKCLKSTFCSLPVLRLHLSESTQTKRKKPCSMTLYMLNMLNHQHILWAAALPSGGYLGMRSWRNTDLQPEVDLTCNWVFWWCWSWQWSGVLLCGVMVLSRNIMLHFASLCICDSFKGRGKGGGEKYLKSELLKSTWPLNWLGFKDAHKKKDFCKYFLVFFRGT